MLVQRVLWYPDVIPAVSEAVVAWPGGGGGGGYKLSYGKNFKHY